MTTTEAPLIVHHDFSPASIAAWFGTDHRPNLGDILATSSTPGDLARALMPDLPSEYLTYLEQRPFASGVLERIGAYQQEIASTESPEPLTESEPEPLADWERELIEAAATAQLSTLAEAAQVLRDHNGNLITDSLGRRLPEGARADATSWSYFGHPRVEMPEGVEVWTPHRGTPLGCRSHGPEGPARGIICTRSAGHEMPHRGGTGYHSLTGEWGIPVGPEAASSEAGAPVEVQADPADVPVGRPAGILIRMPGGRGYRVVLPNGDVMGDSTGDWSNLQRRGVPGQTQAETARIYCREFDAEIVNEGTGSQQAVQAVPQLITHSLSGELLPEHIIRTTTGWASTHAESWEAPWAESVYGPYEGSGGCSARLPSDLHDGASWGWSCTLDDGHESPHSAGYSDGTVAEWGIEPTLATPAPAPAPVSFTSSGGTVLPEDWFRNSPNGLDWCGNSLGGGSYAAADLEVETDIRTRMSGDVCSERVPNGLGVDRRWRCSRRGGHSGHHAAAYDADQILAEWGRTTTVSQGPRVIPVPRTTASNGTPLVQGRHVSTSTAWAVTRLSHRLPLGEDQTDYTNGSCDRRSPRDLGELSGDYYYCTRRTGHEGHHAQANRDGIWAEWDMEPNTITVQPGEDLPPQVNPDLIPVERLVQVMRQFALSHRHDNSVDALQIGLARLGVDLGELPMQEYESTIQIQVPVRFARGSLAGTTSGELAAALPQERIRDAVRRFLAASKLDGEGFGNLEVQADRISINATRPEEI